jgi:predicted Zn finger-like uncharacterized protein
VNVTCDKCNKRYAIADEKVRGKSMVKIRCKQCQNLIAVQGLPALEPAGHGSAAPAAAPRPAPAPAPMPQLSSAPALGDEDQDERTRAMPAIDMAQSWFAMVNKQQVGPFNVRQLEQRVKSNEITLRTYLWKQGMDGWKRASDIPELSPLLAGVSVGATATGPTTSASRPPSASARPAVAARDVAVANETPMPEVTSRPLARPAPAPAAAKQREPEPDEGADPAQRNTEDEQPASSAPLGRQEPSLAGLFDGVDAPSSDLAEGGPGTDAAAPGEQGGADGQDDRHVDPFAALGPVDPKELPPPGEATKFFIAQAGVNKRNPWWKIALFVLGTPALLVGVLFALSTMRIVPLEVTRTAEDGTEVKESFFSAGGVSGLKDLLSGEAKKKRAAAEAKRAQEEAEKAKKLALARAANKGNGEPANEQNERQRPEDALVGKGDGVKVSAQDLAGLYNDAQKGNVGPKVKGETKAADSTQGGLDAAAAEKVVGGSQQAFQGCIEEALKRSPNLKVGKITLTVHVGSSGTVVRTELEPTVHAMSDWGKCLRDRAKRMVFPSFSGDEEAAVQIPLVVGVSVQ